MNTFCLAAKCMDDIICDDLQTLTVGQDQPVPSTSTTNDFQIDGKEENITWVTCPLTLILKI